VILTTATALLYPLAITYKKGGIFAPLKVLALFTALLDIAANYTEVAIVFGWPKPGQVTITKRLKAMVNDPEEFPSRRQFAGMVLTFLDACEKDGVH
jgi:hypothetical protein